MQESWSAVRKFGGEVSEYCLADPWPSLQLLQRANGKGVCWQMSLRGHLANTSISTHHLLCSPHSHQPLSNPTAVPHYCHLKTLQKIFALLWSSLFLCSLIHRPMLIWLMSALLYWHQAVSLLEIFLRCHSDLTVTQEQLNIIALKVEMQDIDVLSEREAHYKGAVSI